EPPTGEDTDGDGVIDFIDDCPEQPEDFDSDADKDGCPEPTVVTFSFLDEATRAPITDVSFTAGDAQGDGAAMSAALASGRYSLTVTAEGYASLEDTFEVRGGPHQTVSRALQSLTGQLVVRAVDSHDGRLLPEATWVLDGEEKGALGEGVELTLAKGEHVVAAHAPGYQHHSTQTEVLASQSSVVEIQLEPAPSQPPLQLHQTIFFATGLDQLLPQDKEKLDEIAGLLLQNPDARVVIEGHTDSRGSEAFNLRLSQARARQVRQYLINRGIEPQRLRSIGRGEADPIDATDNEQAWARNRRVTFVVDESDGTHQAE
ncbi:MAG: OmpA family protein, partial [Myxococcota bacterium]